MVVELFEVFSMEEHLGEVFPHVITFTRTDFPTEKVSHRGAPLPKIRGKERARERENEK